MDTSYSETQHNSHAAAAAETHPNAPSKGLAVEPIFCPTDVQDPFDTVKWDLRSAAIKGENGEVIFEQTDCEIPATWSQLATNIVASKYFYGEVGTQEREKSVRQLIHRVSRTIADWGTADGYFASPEDGERFYRELTWLCLHQHAAFNSPVWFNVGLYHQYGVCGTMCNWHWDATQGDAVQPENPYEFPQASACFIQSVQDNMEDIMELARSEAMLFKFGSGTGTDLSTLRSHREKLSGGGKPSGPLSFMRVYDQIAAVVKCVTADTYLYTADGIRRIGDVVGDAPLGFSPAERLEVATPEGCRAASQVYVSPVSPVRRMTLLHTGLELTGTLEHPVLVLTPDFRLRWKTLGEIEPGDRVAVDRTHGVWSRRAADLTQYHVPVGHGRGEAAKRMFTLPEQMTERLARLLGYLAAEGTVDTERIRFCSADLDVFEDFVRCFEESFGTSIHQGISSRTNPKTGVVTHLFSASWHYVAKFLVNLGAGGKSAEKIVPQAVLDSPRQCAVEFLRGYFEGDGHIGRNIYATTKSPELARQLQVVLLNFGIVSQRRSGEVSGQTYWRVQLCGGNAEKFVDEIRFVSDRKRSVRLPRSSGTNYDVIPHLVAHLRRQFHGHGFYRTAEGETRRTQFEGLFSREGDVSYANLLTRLEAVQTGMAELDPEGLETLVYLLDKKFLWDEVRSIEDAGAAVTYDLTVPEVHAFSSNGIVSHNSGGKTRRAAKMQSLKVGHPDILEFIECKRNEEKKAELLIAKGYDPDDAYSSVLFQNANLSVRVSDDFMQAVEADKPWTTRWVTEKDKSGPTYPARELARKMAEAAWGCGDPGVQYDTTINRWNTCPNSGRINASNPCSEYMFLDDSACNLASINLMKFRRAEGTFDIERFTAACRIVFIAQEILVDHASYPTRRIAVNSHRFRPIGLGYSNLGSLIMASGMPYDSDAARGICGAITALLHGTANRTSAELAGAVGPFEGFAENRTSMLRVMEMHWEKVEEIHACPDYLKSAARKVWDEVLAAGRRYGFRNAQATVLAPTGTISFMMDCDTTGIEPEIALVKYKQLAGGGVLKIINQTVPLALRTLGYSDQEVASIVAYIDKEDTIEGAADLKSEHLPVFDCAFQPPSGTRSITWKAHIRMMAAAQPFLSGAISKTVNMPKDSMPEDIAGAYLEGWKLGLKALAVYRDGSKGTQPLSTKQETETKQPISAPRRERLPDTRQSITHKFSIVGHEGYITVGLYPDGRPGEMFITMAKEGSTVGGLMDCFGTAVSMSLQYGVPLEVYVNKFSHTRFEPMGHTKNPDIRIAKSVVDYIFRWLGITFLPGYREANAALTSTPADLSKTESGDMEAEPRPAAKTAGGPNAGPGSAAASKTPPGGTSNGHANGAAKKTSPARSGAAIAERGNAAAAAEASAYSSTSEQFARFQVDAPSCDNCGAITVRNGNCYLCHVCGNSMGCS